MAAALATELAGAEAKVEALAEEGRGEREALTQQQQVRA